MTSVPPSTEQKEAEANVLIDLLRDLVGSHIPDSLKPLARQVAVQILVRVLNTPDVQGRLDTARKAFEGFKALASVFS